MIVAPPPSRPRSASPAIRDHDLLHLFYTKGWSVRRIARRLGTTRDAVRDRIAVARARVVARPGT